MKTIIDTDILSMFAKIDKVNLLIELFGQGQVIMTPAIREELAAALEYGYTFPAAVFSELETFALGKDEDKGVIRQCLQ